METLRNLTEIECVIAVAKHQSFTKAARELRISKNSVSRFVTTLEERLGEKVFRRTTREVFLTGFGEKTVRQFEEFWESLNKLESQLANSTAEPSGTLRIFASNALSESLLYPKLQEFQETYKKVRTEIFFSDAGAESWNLDAQDIHVLFGFPHVPSLTDDWRFRHLLDIQQMLVASPPLLKKHGPITTVEGLKELPFVTHISRVPRNIIVLQEGKKLSISEPIISANSFTHLKELCKAGVGAALLGKSIVEKEVESGELIAILPQLPYIVFQLHIFCRANEYSVPKIRAFMDFFNRLAPNETAGIIKK